MSALLCSVTGKMITTRERALKHVKACGACRPLIRLDQPRRGGKLWTVEKAAEMAQRSAEARARKRSQSPQPAAESPAAPAWTDSPVDRLQEAPTALSAL